MGKRLLVGHIFCTPGPCWPSCWHSSIFERIWGIYTLRNTVDRLGTG